MKIQNKPDYLIFADDAKTGELESFPNILRGWGITIDQTQSKPPMEWMNGVFHRIDENTLYLLQQGVPEWDSNVLYPVDAVIKYKSKLYIATVQNDNAIPSTNTTKWSKVVPDIIDASITQKGVVKLNSAINSTSTTEAATPSAVKTAYDLANTDATTSVKGRVQLNSAINSIAENQAATPKAVKIAYDLANTDATTSVKGRVQLNSAINSVLETQAATPKAVKVAYDLANSRLPLTGGTVTGTTNFTGKLQQAGSDVITTKTISNYQGLGVGQKWYDVKESRQLGVTYTNTTGRPIVIAVSLIGYSSSPWVGMVTTIDNVSINTGSGGHDASWATKLASTSLIVPSGSTYKVTTSDGGKIYIWAELK